MRTTSFLATGIVALAVVGTSACSQTNSGYASGELGNGGFYLSCDDAVACAAGSDDAKKFPKTVALGSTFSVRFTNATQAGTNIQLSPAAPSSGITVDPVGGYITRGPNGMSGQVEGYATIAAHDAAGQLIDFVNVEVGKPDALVVYDAGDEFGTATPATPFVGSIYLDQVGARRTLKAFAQRKKTTLAGTIAIEWQSSDPTIFDIETAGGTAANIVAIKSGTAMLTASGGAFQQQLQVVVP